MMTNKLLDTFLCSFFATIIIGMMVNRLLPTWEGLVADVSTSGAWIASIIYYFVYGFAISSGAILSRILYKNATGSCYFWIITTGVIVVISSLYLLLTPLEFHFSVFFLLLILVSCLMFLLSSVVWNRFCSHKSAK